MNTLQTTIMRGKREEIMPFWLDIAQGLGSWCTHKSERMYCTEHRSEDVIRNDCVTKFMLCMEPIFSSP